ncbi:FxSxx-COOH system tetratricopeptide repeat protein [Frankia sp. AgKG'84/4]|uniref:FxSxx-COOH system tetratricopeptide repeat protein n=1 Tax=Frankia sp. AgKG'84/4 TaxID=573490 RepID=UPI00200D60CC|nr:FxSxx-COOH system tetratricopeptide repeat protein [Frankia sp. AgKG'84/4]MCL9794262.1 FxSxx-COOH system tetratricopeptide repeat protein [Frankia sp. AgKG'84/4]
MHGWDEPAAASTDFFVSCAESDRLWAEWVAAELEAAGRTVLLQTWDAVAGVNFVVWMSRSMAASRRIVALYSPAYFESGWCTAECTVAFGRQVLLPFKVAECEVPAVLATTGYTSLHGLEEATTRERLLRGAGLRARPRRFDDRFPGGAAPVPHPPDEPRRAETAAPFPAASPATWSLRRPRSTWFVGRDALLTDMYERFRSVPVDRTGAQVVAGIGGVGKTQLAVEYAHRFAARYSLVSWVDAAEPTTMVESFDALADALRLPADPDVDRRARRALASLREESDWLVIFDNVENRQLLADWWPTVGGGDILVTGRSRLLEEFGEMRNIGTFSPEEAVSLLRRRASRLTEFDALRLAEALGSLPLALGQAAAYLAATGISADDYLELVTASVSTAFADNPADYPAGLVGSVTTAMNRLVHEDPAVAEVFRIAAFLAPAPLSTQVLDAVTALVLPGAVPIVTRSRVLRGLDTFALAQISGGVFETHRLTQAVLRDQLSPEDRGRLGAQAAAALVVAAPAQPDDPASWPEYATLAPHVSAMIDHPAGGRLPRFRGLVLMTVEYLTNSGQHAAALALANAVVDTWTPLDGPDGLDRLGAAHRLGEALRGAGRFGDAENLDRDTHARRCRILGSDHRESLRSAAAVGTDLRGTGDRTGARDWNSTVLTAARAVLGSDDPLALDIAASLALDLHGLGAIAAARELDEEVLARRRAVLGDTHQRTLASARGLARDLRALGLHEQARDLARQTLDTLTRILGADHPDTLLAASSLAVLHYALGDLQTARDLHQDSYNRSTRVLGPDHRHTLRIANSLAVDLFRLGDPQAALDLHQETFDRLRRTAGPDHPDTLHTAHNLARDLDELGQQDNAVDLFEDTLRRRILVLGDDHRETRRTRDRLARIRARDTAAEIHPHPEAMT